MNRKSAVQVALLVILLVVGAGVYLSQQEGGLDFLKEAVGLSPAPPTQVTLPKVPPKRPAPPAPPPVPVKAEPQEPPIPPGPVQGQIQKAAFTVESAEIENGVLTLRQGKEPLATEIKLFLYTKPWHVPAERSFQILGQTNAPDAPLVRIHWQENGQKARRQRDFTDKYTLKLELGREQDRKLPGKIHLTLPDEDKSEVAGTFTAEVRGFRFIDGKPDLASDSVDTLQYLALREILKDDPDKPIDDLAFRHGRYAPASPLGPATGYLEVEYRSGDDGLIGRKFQFVKERNSWRVARTLRPDQLDEAHPYRVPAPNAAPQRLFPYLAAKRIEADAKKRAPSGALGAVEFTTRHNEKQKIGVAEVSYKVGDGQTLQTAFLYRLNANGWTLVRELGKKERVNLATGKVETQR